MADNGGWTEVIITICTAQESDDGGPASVHTEVRRLEFETKDDALAFLDTSEGAERPLEYGNPKGLIASQEMGQCHEKI